MKKRLISILLIIVFTILVLYFSLKDDYILVINTILNLKISYLLIAFFLLFGYYYFKALVMWIMAKQFKVTYKFSESFKMILETNFFHAVTPFSSGGQPYEIYALKKSGIKILDSTNISIQSFITYQIALVLLGIVAMISNQLFNFYPSSKILSKLVAIGFIANLLVIIGLFVLTFMKKVSKIIINLFLDLLSKLKIVKNKSEKQEKIEIYLNDFYLGAKILLDNKIQFLGCIFLQLLSLLSLYLIPFALILGLGILINPFIVVVTTAYVMLIGSFVPIPGGTGGLEYGFVAFFGNFVIGNKVNAIMLVWRFITYYFGMILGAIMLSIKKEKKSENRNFY